MNLSVFVLFSNLISLEMSVTLVRLYRYIFLTYKKCIYIIKRLMFDLDFGSRLVWNFLILVQVQIRNLDINLLIFE